MNIRRSIDDMIGKTPLQRAVNIEKKEGLCAELYLKLENMNPTGSAKDRAALYMLNEAEKAGRIKEGAVIIEPTSGNTGIGLAAIGSDRGYRVIIVMPDSMSVERQRLMRAYGAELVLTPGEMGMSGAIKKACELAADIPGSFIPDQFSNPANAKAHFETTGPEIYQDTDGEVDIFVAGVGTGGTITGVGEYLKSKNPNVKIVAVEPCGSAVLSGGKPGAHKLQGIGAGFVPKVLNTEIYDRVMAVTAEEAYSAARLLAKCEGILAGISSGAALSAAMTLAKEEEHSGKRIVVLIPDTGMRYLSGDLFE